MQRVWIGLVALTLVVMASAAAAESWKVEKLPGIYKFTEGPVWTPWGTLLFSDIPENKIWEVGKETKVYRDPSGNSNGLTFDHEGRLIACEHGNRRVTRTEKDGKITVLADSYESKRLNSPNDVVVKRDGTVYFTDPPYGIDIKHREQPCNGVYRVKPGGKPELLVADFDMPNGLCFSADESKLYIADSSNRRHIRVFKVAKDGTLSGGEVFVTLGAGAPDGMKMGADGNLYSTGGGGVWIYDPTGKHLETIPVPETPANLAWGDKDGKTLYITARTSVYKARKH